MPSRPCLPLAPLAAVLALAATGALAQMPPNPPVEIATPLADTVTDYDVFTGRFEAAREVDLRARVSGYLDSVTFEDGTLVKQGDVLFTIDQRPFEAAVRRAEAALASARASAELAQIELDRATQLAERNVGTEQEVDRTQAQLSEAMAQVQVAEADLVTAKLDLEFTTIEAPFDGRVSETTVDAGNLVIGGTSNTTALTTLVSVAPIFFTFTVSEADFLRYTRFVPLEDRPSANGGGDWPVGIRLLDEDSFVHQGRLDFVDNRLNPNSGSISVRAVVDNPSNQLVPGVFGRIRVAASAPYEALLVPDEAVLSDQANKIVMTAVPAEEEGLVRVQPARVTLGPLHRGLRVIRSGIDKDTRVIVTGVQRAMPGSTVTPEETTLSFADEQQSAGTGEAASSGN
ncbi:MAG: efflux RND transporter periplasmic adaptor subunit [Pseudomonadota bacterium]